MCKHHSVLEPAISMHDDEEQEYASGIFLLKPKFEIKPIYALNGDEFCINANFYISEDIYYLILKLPYVKRAFSFDNQRIKVILYHAAHYNGTVESINKILNDYIKSKTKPMETKKPILLSVEEARNLLGQNSTIDKLIHANFTEEELKPRVKKWEDLGMISGYCITKYSGLEYEPHLNSVPAFRNLFVTENQAKSALAMAQLSQLMKHVNGGWVPDWGLDGEEKYCIRCYKNGIELVSFILINQFLAFKTPEIRNQFLRDHKELIEQYFLMYQ